MIAEHRQDQAGLYALDALFGAERAAFEEELRGDAGPTGRLLAGPCRGR